MWITVDLHDVCGHLHSAGSNASSGLSLRRMAESPIPATGNALTSRNAARPLRAATGALTATVAVALPVFLVGGLAVQISDELRFSPAGLGLAVSAYFGASALASLPAGALVERYGAARITRCGIALSAAALLAVAVAATALWSLIAILALGAGANAMGQLASNTSLSRHVPAGRQGLSFGVKQAAIPVCSLLAGLAVPAVALTIGWRWAFVLAAGLAAAAILLVPADLDPPPAAAAGGARRPPAPSWWSGWQQCWHPVRPMRSAPSWSTLRWRAAFRPGRPGWRSRSAARCAARRAWRADGRPTGGRVVRSG